MAKRILISENEARSICKVLTEGMPDGDAARDKLIKLYGRLNQKLEERKNARSKQTN